jgi:hypothetical protein
MRSLLRKGGLVGTPMMPSRDSYPSVANALAGTIGICVPKFSLARETSYARRFITSSSTCPFGT